MASAILSSPFSYSAAHHGARSTRRDRGLANTSGGSADSNSSGGSSARAGDNSADNLPDLSVLSDFASPNALAPPGLDDLLDVETEEHDSDEREEAPPDEEEAEREASAGREAYESQQESYAHTHSTPAPSRRRPQQQQQHRQQHDVSSPPSPADSAALLASMRPSRARLGGLGAAAGAKDRLVNDDLLQLVDTPPPDGFHDALANLDDDDDDDDGSGDEGDRQDREDERAIRSREGARNPSPTARRSRHHHTQQQRPQQRDNGKDETEESTSVAAHSSSSEAPSSAATTSAEPQQVDLAPAPPSTPPPSAAPARATAATPTVYFSPSWATPAASTAGGVPMSARGTQHRPRVPSSLRFALNASPEPPPPERVTTRRKRHGRRRRAEAEEHDEDESSEAEVERQMLILSSEEEEDNDDDSAASDDEQAGREKSSDCDGQEEHETRDQSFSSVRLDGDDDGPEEQEEQARFEDALLEHEDKLAQHQSPHSRSSSSPSTPRAVELDLNGDASANTSGQSDGAHSSAAGSVLEYSPSGSVIERDDDDGGDGGRPNAAAVAAAAQAQLKAAAHAIRNGGARAGLLGNSEWSPAGSAHADVPTSLAGVFDPPSPPASAQLESKLSEGQFATPQHPNANANDDEDGDTTPIARPRSTAPVPRGLSSSDSGTSTPVGAHTQPTAAPRARGRFLRSNQAAAGLAASTGSIPTATSGALARSTGASRQLQMSVKMDATSHEEQETKREEVAEENEQHTDEIPQRPSPTAHQLTPHPIATLIEQDDSFGGGSAMGSGETTMRAPEGESATRNQWQGLRQLDSARRPSPSPDARNVSLRSDSSRGSFVSEEEDISDDDDQPTRPLSEYDGTLTESSASDDNAPFEGHSDATSEGDESAEEGDTTHEASARSSASVSPAPAARSSISTAPTPGGGLFKFQYDTFTRNHLEALADEIAAERAASPEAGSDQEEAAQAEEDDDSSSSVSGRSPKRARLSDSPAASSSGTMTPVSTPARSRRQSVSSRRRVSPDSLDPVGHRRRQAMSSRRDCISRASPAPATPARTAASVRLPPSTMRLSKTEHTAEFAKTRDRIEEAKLLIERIRERQVEKEHARAARAMESSSRPSSPVAGGPPRSPRPVQAVEGEAVTIGLPRSKSPRASTSSPRKSLRRLSASFEMERARRGSVSPPATPASKAAPDLEVESPPRESPPLPAHLAAAAKLSLRSALRTGSFSSVSPAQPAQGSAHRRTSSLTFIAPDDAGATRAATLAASTSNMVFDASTGRWVREANESEEDPFKDFDSIAGSDSLRSTVRAADKEPASEQRNTHDEQGADAEAQVAASTSVPKEPMSPLSQFFASPHLSFMTPATELQARQRPALKAAMRSVSEPVVSPAHDRAIATGVPPSTVLRVNGTQVPRSVSFTDGKKSGKLEGIIDRDEYFAEAQRVGQTEVVDENADASGDSCRTDDLINTVRGTPGQLSVDNSQESSQSSDPSPSVKAAASRSARTLLVSENGSPGAGDSSALRSSIASGSVLVRRKRDLPEQPEVDSSSLTHFGESHDRLTQLLREVEPESAEWERLTKLEWRESRLDSLVHLKELVPALDEADLSFNDLRFLIGLPSTLRTLSLRANLLHSLTTFGHLRHLEYLDISDNHLETLEHLAPLRHLRELKADRNRIVSLDGLSAVDGLLKISLVGNEIETADFSSCSWHRLERLDLSHNSLVQIDGLEALPALRTLLLDSNRLETITCVEKMPQLRVLRACANPITRLDVSFAPRLRTLYLDGTKMGRLEGCDELIRLENLSARDQGGSSLTLPLEQVKDVKRLYLGGNPLPSLFPVSAFFNLIHLELAFARLQELPANLSKLIPNVRVLDLNFNFLDDLSPLHGLTRLRKLTVMSNRVAKARPLIELLRTLPELEVLDLRLNPVCLPFYLPLATALHPAQLGSGDGALVPESAPPELWQQMDKRYRRAMPDEWYLKRVTYRNLILSAAPKLEVLDGIGCTGERERISSALGRVQKQLE